MRSATAPFNVLSVLVSLVVLLALTRPAFSAGLNFAGVPLTPGATVRVSVPLSALEKAYVAEGGNAEPPYTVATLAVPPGFDPKKSWPVLVVFSSSDHQHQNRDDLMRLYRRLALAEGWVLIAGDGPAPAPRADSPGWRAGHTLAALDALHRSFPGSTQWPVACAGQSGGSKRASYFAPLLAVVGNRIIGVFLEGITQEEMPAASEPAVPNQWVIGHPSVCCESITEGYRRFQPGRGFLRTPIFLSTGLFDKIATPEQQTAVAESMRRAGFTNVRHVTFPGGHTVLHAHFIEALRWFRKGS
jgi:pimeloyl-ACP methyl ester carboxylesterase